MKGHNLPQHSLSEVHESVDTTVNKTGWKRLFAFVGPAYLVSVGYMDPGNWATDIAGGSKFGYSLIWVLLASNLMAILLQSLSARLGIVRGRDLAQANREEYPKAVNFCLWILAELAIAATDLAEILGMAIGLQLLFDLPLIIGVGITVLDTFLLLYLQKLGIRKIEAFIVSLIGVIGIAFLVNIILASPDFSQVIKGFIPSFPDAATLYAKEGIIGQLPTETALYLAIGIIGATVMPHNLYLHSALIQTRKIDKSEKGIREALKWSLIDSSIALNIAFFINAAILILAATLFFKSGRTDVGEIRQAHELLSPMLGTGIASTLFAIALIASGQSSTITGTLSGQIVMEGYLHLRINPVMRRLITRLIAIVPAVLVILLAGERYVDELLVFSQVILSLQLGFAIIPLIHFVSNKKTMGVFTIKPIIKLLAWLMAAILVYLNLKMASAFLMESWQHNKEIWIRALLVIGPLSLIVLLLVTFFYPILKKSHRHGMTSDLHPAPQTISLEKPATFRRVAIALDFGESDTKLLSTVLQYKKETIDVILIHVVQSASASVHGAGSQDFESINDQQRMNQFVTLLKTEGYETKGILGYRDTASEIVRIVYEEKADLLIIGAHGHRGIKDFFYGSTIDRVRHRIEIPVYIIQL